MKNYIFKVKVQKGQHIDMAWSTASFFSDAVFLTGAYLVISEGVEAQGASRHGALHIRVSQ